MIFDKWSEKSLFKAAIALCAHLAHDHSNLPALYELGVVDALVFFILREFDGKRTEDSRWWFSALKSIISDYQLSQDAVEDGGGRKLLHDVINSQMDSPIVPDEAPKIKSKSVFAAVLTGGIREEVLQRRMANEDYHATQAERLEKVQQSYDFLDPSTFRESLIHVRVQRERAMNLMEEIVNLCTGVQQSEQTSTTAYEQALVAQQSAAMAGSAKECHSFAKQASNAASSACEAAEEASNIVIKILQKMKETEQAAEKANLMSRLEPVRMIASSTAECATRTSDNARNATALAATATEHFDVIKANEYKEVYSMAYELSVQICASAASLHIARQSFLHAERALQSAEDNMTYSASTSSLTVERPRDRVSVMDSMARIQACVGNLQNVRAFLTQCGAPQCAEECDKMLIAAVSSAKRASALAVARDVAIAPYRTIQSMVGSVLEDVVSESFHMGEELMLEKANKLWSIMLSKRFRRKREVARQNILEGITEVSRSAVLEAADRAVSEVEFSRCQSIGKTAQNVLGYGEKLYAESQGYCNAFLECSVKAAKQCEASHTRMTSCMMELRAKMNKCAACVDILDPSGASKEMQMMWTIFSEMESNIVNVKQSYEEKALRDRLTRAGLIPAVNRKKKNSPVEPSQDLVVQGAVISGDDQGLKVMLVQGCNAKANTTGGYTLLHEAAERGHAKVAKLLIYGGADVTQRTLKGSTPLLTAAFFGHAEAVGVWSLSFFLFETFYPTSTAFLECIH